MRKKWMLGSVLLMQSIWAAVPDFSSMPVITKLTGTTCWYCGQWGWETMTDIMAKYDENSLVMASYDSYFQGGNPGETNLNNDYSQAWNDGFGGGGFPSFAVNEVIQTNSTLSSEDVRAAAEAHFAKTQNIGMNFEAWISGNTVKVARTIQSKGVISGSYTINTFLLEDSVMHYQSGPAEAVMAHHNVLRAMNSTNSRGDALPSKALNGQVYVDTVTLAIRAETPAWNSKKFKIGLALWNGKTFVNAYTRPISQTWDSQSGLSSSGQSSSSGISSNQVSSSSLSSSQSSSSGMSSSVLSSSALSSSRTQSSSSANTPVLKTSELSWNVRTVSQGLWIQQSNAFELKTQFSVFDLQGQKLSQFELGNSVDHYLVPLSVAGTYLVRSLNNQGQQSHFYEWHP